MATLINCPRTDCAHNRGEVCDMAGLKLATPPAWLQLDWLGGERPAAALVCLAFRKREEEA